MDMQNVESYLDGLYAPDEALERIKRSIADRGMRDISVGDSYGRLLTMLARMIGATRALEIGAFGGYSGLCLLRGLTGEAKLVSLELKSELADLARGNLEQAGYGANVEYRIGPALDSLMQLKQEGQQFDLFFIDADKENYPNYLEAAIQLASSGALIIADNLMLRGRTLNPDKQGPAVLAMRRFNEMVAQDPRIDSTMLSSYDGLAIMRVK